MAEDEKQDSVPKMIHVSSFKIITWFFTILTLKSFKGRFENMFLLYGFMLFYYFVLLHDLEVLAYLYSDLASDC